MKYLLWWWFEGRHSPSKIWARMLHYRMFGMSHQRKARRELEKLRKPEYKIPENLK